MATARQQYRAGVAWILALSVVGYQIAGLIAAGSGLSSIATSIPFRLVVIALAMLIFVDAAAGRARFRIDLLLLLFWAVYALRLVWDTAVAAWPDADTALVFYAATVVIPCLAVMLAARDYDEPTAAWAMFLVGATASTLAVFAMLLGLGGSTSLTEETGRLSFEAVNPILLGHAGVTTILAALAAWTSSGRSRKLLLVAGSGFGVACTILAASRGPLLALAAALLVYAVVKRKWLWLIVVAAVAAYVLPALVADSSVELLARFSNIDQDESALERLAAQANAITEFLDNPLLGNAYIEPITNEYPHNLFIESAMALGIGGLGLFALISIRAGFRALARLRAGALLVPLLFIEYFTGAQLSGALWGSTGLWMTVTLLAVSPALANAGRRAARLVSA